MKTIVTLLITLITSTAFAQQSSSDIKVIVNNIESSEGTIQIGLYNQETEFLVKTHKSIEVKAKQGSVEATFKNIPSGTYAISLYHDEDDNKELNKIFGMIPSEPYGISNNAKEMYSAPTWKKAKFEVKEPNLVQEISL